MMLDEEDKQIIDMLDKKDKEQVLDLKKEVDVLYEILSHMEAIRTDLGSIYIDGEDKRHIIEIMFRLYDRRDSLEEKISIILKNFWENTIHKVKRKRKLIYKKIN